MPGETASVRQTQIHLLSFDAQSAVVANWLSTWLEGWEQRGCLAMVAPAFVRPEQTSEAGLWLLLEQMHLFDFIGPEINAVRPLITSDSLGTYGLRGRLFWEAGQIEWRRLAPENLRVVIMSEHSMPIAAPEDVHVTTETHLFEPYDSHLILWGTSLRNEGVFRELRVAGSASLKYPKALEQTAAQIKGAVYPALPFRTYIDLEGREQFRRFLPPAARDEQSLKQLISFDPKQTEHRDG